MKPKPTRSTQAATCSGPSSSFTPSASSTSALPQRLVAARLPCLATGWPSAPTTRPAAVETLKVPEESPPVPQVSTARMCAGSGTWTACSRITRASPATSSTVSPLRRSAVRKAPSCEGVATPVMISSIAAAASLSLSASPATSCVIASRIITRLLIAGTTCTPREHRSRCSLGGCWVRGVEEGGMELAAIIGGEQIQQIAHGGCDIRAACRMMRLDGDERLRGVLAGGALLALTKTPAPRMHVRRVVGEDDLTRLRMLDRSITKRGIFFRAVGEAYGDRTRDGSRIKDGDGQGVADADEVAEIHQRVDAGDVALLRQAAQQGLGGAAVLCWVHAECPKGIAPRRQRGDLAQRRRADALQHGALLGNVGSAQRCRRGAVGQTARQDDAPD